MIMLEAPGCVVRPARTADVPAIRRLVDHYAPSGMLLSKPTVSLYEAVQEFRVAELDGQVVGCGAVHVMWEDLAEVRTVAVDPAYRGRGVGDHIVPALLDVARDLGVRRGFVLPFPVALFPPHRVTEGAGAPVGEEGFAGLLRAYHEGVAEFLGPDPVKAQT